MCYLKLFHLFFLFIWLGGLIVMSRMVASLAKEEPIVQNRNISLWRSFYLSVDLPAMILAIFSGILLLILKKVSFLQAWLHLKLTTAFFLIALDSTMGFLLMREKAFLSKRKAIVVWVVHAITLLFLFAALFSICVLKK